MFRARIRIGCDAPFRKEGEISVFLELEGLAGPITGMAFSLGQNGGWIALIGGFQGRKGGDDRIRPNERSRYAKRYLLLDDLFRQIRAHLAA